MRSQALPSNEINKVYMDGLSDSHNFALRSFGDVVSNFVGPANRGFKK